MIKETDVGNILEEYLTTRYEEVYKEIPVFSKRIDFVCINKQKELVAIEVKVKNWQKALQQALFYRICAHRVYVAIWHEFSHRVNRHLFNEFGIGLLEINGEVKQLVKPKKSKYVQKTPLNLIKNNLYKVMAGGEQW